MPSMATISLREQAQVHLDPIVEQLDLIFDHRTILDVSSFDGSVSHLSDKSKPTP
jgi:hypothetical protein